MEANSQESLRKLTLQLNATQRELLRLETKHKKLVEYEQKAWAALRAKDAELIKREAALRFEDGSLASSRTFLPEM